MKISNGAAGACFVDLGNTFQDREESWTERERERGVTVNESSGKKAIARKRERKRERGQQGIKRRSTQRQLLGYSGRETSVPEFS